MSAETDQPSTASAEQTSVAADDEASAAQSSTTTSAAPNETPEDTFQRPRSLAALAANTSSASGSGAAKKFASSLSVNKKFLEKTGVDGAKTPFGTSSKAGPSSFRPLTPTASLSSPLQSTSPNALPSQGPRLLSGKITTSPFGQPPGTLTPAGWAKQTLPGLAGPARPLQPSPSNAAATAFANQLDFTGGGLPLTSGPPPLLSKGKPSIAQSSAAVSRNGLASKFSSGRPAGPSNVPWARVDHSAGANNAIGNADFPSVAEAARSKELKAHALATAAAAKEAKDKKSQEIASQAAAAYRKHLLEESEAFRGTNLGPNMVHWDEMGDDDDFGDMLDFGDGAQYKIPIEAAPAESQKDQQTPSNSLTNSQPAASQQPLNDFDRGEASSRARTSDRSLFNDRLGKFEPYARNKKDAMPTDPRKDTQVLKREKSLSPVTAKKRLPSDPPQSLVSPPASATLTAQPLISDSSRTEPAPATTVAISSAAVVSESPAAATAQAPPQASIEELHQREMHAAAERARKRRADEEAARQAEIERARKKAAELEARFAKPVAAVSLNVKATETKIEKQNAASSAQKEATADRAKATGKGAESNWRKTSAATVPTIQTTSAPLQMPAVVSATTPSTDHRLSPSDKTSAIPPSVESRGQASEDMAQPVLKEADPLASRIAVSERIDSADVAPTDAIVREPGSQPSATAVSTSQDDTDDRLHRIDTVEAGKFEGPKKGKIATKSEKQQQRREDRKTRRLPHLAEVASTAQSIVVDDGTSRGVQSRNVSFSLPHREQPIDAEGSPSVKVRLSQIQSPDSDLPVQPSAGEVSMNDALDRIRDAILASQGAQELAIDWQQFVSSSTERPPSPRPVWKVLPKIKVSAAKIGGEVVPLRVVHPIPPEQQRLIDFHSKRPDRLFTVSWHVTAADRNANLFREHRLFPSMTDPTDSTVRLPGQAQRSTRLSDRVSEIDLHNIRILKEPDETVPDHELFGDNGFAHTVQFLLPAITVALPGSKRKSEIKADNAYSESTASRLGKTKPAVRLPSKANRMTRAENITEQPRIDLQPQVAAQPPDFTQSRPLRSFASMERMSERGADPFANEFVPRDRAFRLAAAQALGAEPSFGRSRNLAGPDPSNLNAVKAVWAQPSPTDERGPKSVAASNSLKGLTDDFPTRLPTMNELRLEDGGVSDGIADSASSSSEILASAIAKPDASGDQASKAGAFEGIFAPTASSLRAGSNGGSADDRHSIYSSSTWNPSQQRQTQALQPQNSQYAYPQPNGNVAALGSNDIWQPLQFPRAGVAQQGTDSRLYQTSGQFNRYTLPSGFTRLPDNDTSRSSHAQAHHQQEHFSRQQYNNGTSHSNRINSDGMRPQAMQPHSTDSNAYPHAYQRAQGHW